LGLLEMSNVIRSEVVQTTSFRRSRILYLGMQAFSASELCLLIILAGSCVYVSVQLVVKHAYLPVWAVVAAVWMAC
jgi:hypothetical protein